MTAFNRTLASLSAILLAGLISTALPFSAVAATNVTITSFRAAWTSTTTYAAGAVVIYNGASYISLVSNNKNVAPSSSTTDWAILDPAGAIGATGPAGKQGPAGPQGAQGAAGATGAQGIMGPPGLVGPAGATGSQGAAGVQGPAGPRGLTGATGATGPQGPAGPAGTNGSGAGFTYENTWTSSTPYTPNEVVSESGTSYIALQNNSGVDPANDLRTSGGNWAVLAAAGAQGATGLTGAIGPAGAQGPQGASGPIGPQGLLGATGPIGPAGTSGAMGPAGALGPAGPAGPAGSTGATGGTGAQGPAGPQGSAGPAGPQGQAGTGAGFTSCSTYITGPSTIQGDVIVPDGAYCTLGYDPPYSTPCCNPPPPPGYGPVSVTGNVTVGAGSSLVVGLNSKITGSIHANGCGFVELVSEGNEEVDGDVQVLNCNGGYTPGQPAFLSNGSKSVIYGSLKCLNDTGPCVLQGAIVGGNVQIVNTVPPAGSVTSAITYDVIYGSVQILNNSPGSPFVIEANQIFGNLQCESNSPAPSNGGVSNTVAGNEQGQCVGF